MQSLHIGDHETDAENHRTKSNVLMVPVYASLDWDKMISLGTQTIKEMLKASHEKQESTPKTSAKQRKVELERQDVKNIR